MRIAVCAPQVPFARGGAEIFADDLVGELRERGHETDLVTIPYKWYPGERVLSQAFLWRLLDLSESDGRTIDLVIATKFPSYAVRHPNKIVWLLHQFRQAYELDRTELGQFGESAEDRATRRAVQRLDGVALGEARKVFATSRNVADRLQRSTGIEAEVMPHPPQELAYRTESYDDFVLSVGRLDRAKRHELLLDALAADTTLRCVIVGDGPDRERLEDVARRHGLDGRARFTGRIDEEELATLYARCLAVYYAPVDEDFGMVPYEAFLAEKPVVTTTDAGRTARGRLRSKDRNRLRAAGRRACRGMLLATRTPGRREDVGAGRQGDRAPRVLGRDDRAPARVKVAYYSPLPPERSGIADYSRAALAGTRPPRRARGRQARTHPPGRSGRCPVSRRQRSGGARLDHRCAEKKAGCRRPARFRSPPSRRRAHDRPQGRPRLSRRDGTRRGIPGRLLAHGVLDGRVPPPWETSPAEFPLVGEVLANATGLIVHSHYVEERAREAGYRGPVWRVEHPAWPPVDVEPAGIEGRPLFGCFGHLNASKRIPQLIQAFGLVRERHPHAKLLLVGPASPGFDADRLVTDGVERIGYVEEDRLWSLMASCDACISLRAPTMGETSGSAIRALSLGRPLVVSDLGWFSELPDDVALKVPVDDDEIASIATALELLASSEPTQLAMSDAARSYVEREHDLGRVAEEYAAALEDAAGGTSVADAVVAEVAHAAAEIGIEPGTPFAAELAGQLDEVGLARNGRPAQQPAPSRGANLLARVPVWAWLTALVVVSSVFRYGLSRRVVAPWIMVDELIYSELAKSFADTGHFLIRDVHHGAYGAVYPLLIAPAWKLFGSVPDAYAAAKTIGSVLMSLTAIPVYFLARRVIAPIPSLLAALLAVAVPSLMYTGTLMTETVFYPLFACVALALVLALERPTIQRQLVLLALCLLAFLTRSQAIVLIPAVATAPLVLAWLDRRRLRMLADFKALYGALLRRGRRRARRAARPRTLAVRRPRQLQRDGSRDLQARSGLEVGAVPPGRARSLSRDRSFRGAAVARHRRPVARPAASVSFSPPHCR